MRLRSFSAIPLAVFCVAFVPSASLAQNLLVNPNFDTSLSGWNTGGDVGVFDGTMDADGSSSSGSLKGTYDVPPSGGTTGAAHQCVTGIIAGTTYYFGGKFFVTSGPASRLGTVIVHFFSDNSCNTFPTLSGAETEVVRSTGSWVARTASLTAPAGAMSVEVSTNFGTDTVEPGLVVVNFDDLFFQQTPPPPSPPPPPPVPALSAAGLIALALALGGIGTLVLRKLS